jgi:hypothetical protein
VLTPVISCVRHRHSILVFSSAIVCSLLAQPSMAQRISEGSNSDRGRLSAVVLTSADTRMADALATLPAAQAKAIRSEQLLSARASGKSFERALMDRGFTAAEAATLVDTVAARLTPFVAPPRAPVVPPTTVTYPPRDAAGEYEVFFGYETRFDDGFGLQQQKAPAYFWYALSPWISAEVDFDAFLSVAGSGAWKSSAGDTTLNIKPVLLQQSTRGLPKVTGTYALKLPTASRNVGTGSTDHIVAFEALRTFGADYRHLFVLTFETDWVGAGSSQYDRSSSLFGRVRFRLPWQLLGRYGIESETDGAWADLTERVGFVRQGLRVRLPHDMKVRAGARLGLGSGVSNGFYVDARIGGVWLPRRPS